MLFLLPRYGRQCIGDVKTLVLQANAIVWQERQRAPLLCGVGPGKIVGEQQLHVASQHAAYVPFVEWSNDVEHLRLASAVCEVKGFHTELVGHGADDAAVLFGSYDAEAGNLVAACVHHEVVLYVFGMQCE